MEQIEMTGGVWILRLLSWAIWVFLSSCMLYYIQFPSLGLSTSNIEQNVFYILFGCSILLSLLLFTVILIVRHFGLIKPSRKGTYSPTKLKGMFRLFLLSLLFWIIIDLVALVGLFLFFLSGKAWPIYAWVTISLGFMCFFTPRLKPFIHNESMG